MSETTLNDSIDDILDATLDEMSDLPEFKPFPPGAHKVTLNWKETTQADKKDPSLKFPAVELKLTYKEVLELNPGYDTPPKKGDTVSILFILKMRDKETGAIVKNVFAEGGLKEVLKPLGQHFNLTSPREIMSASENAEVVVATGLRKDTNYKENGREYTTITNLIVE